MYRPLKVTPVCGDTLVHAVNYFAKEQKKAMQINKNACYLQGKRVHLPFIFQNIRISLMQNRYSLKNITGFLLAAIAVVAAAQLMQSYQGTSPQNEPRSQVPYNVTSPEVPASMMFAGENVDLTRSDLRERMDREILTFTYSHINTQLMLKRANRIFPIVEPILKEQGVHDDFKYLMIIESNGDVYARSSVGAGGLWQFMPATAKQYSLEVNNSVDERYNIEKATRAACRYIKAYYTTFGDWLTVAASYNAGGNSVSKRIAAQKESKATDLALVPETSRYLFRILTAKLIFSSPSRYGFLLKSSDLYPPVVYSDTVETSAATIDFTAIAKKHGINYLQLRDANPWVRSTTHRNPNRKSYKLLIPSKESQYYNPKETKPHSSAWVIK